VYALLCHSCSLNSSYVLETILEALDLGIQFLRFRQAITQWIACSHWSRITIGKSKSRKLNMGGSFHYYTISLICDHLQVSSINSQSNPDSCDIISPQCFHPRLRTGRLTAVSKWFVWNFFFHLDWPQCTSYYWINWRSRKTCDFDCW
jgi:hypothetical protein